MSALDLVLAGVIVALLVAVAVLAARHRAATRPQATDPDPAAGTAVAVSRTRSVAASVPVSASEFLVGTDGPSGHRELQIQVLPDPEASAFARANVRFVDERPSPALQPLLSGLPSACALIRAGTVVRILNPELLAAGEMTPSKAGGVLGVVRNIGTKGFVGQLRFEDPQNLAMIGTPAVAFVALSAVTGQYYLNRINKQLSAIQRGVDDIEQHLRNAVYGDVMASAEACHDLEVKLERTGGVSPADRVKLDSAESRIDVAFHRLEKDLLDFRDDVENLADGDRRKKERKSLARQALGDAQGKRLYDVQLFVFSCAVRHKLNVFQVILAELEGYPPTIALAAEKLEQERTQMEASLHEIQLAFSRLDHGVTSLDEELWFGVLSDDDLKTLVGSVRSTTNLLRRSETGVLPPAPRTPPYLEAMMADDGSWRVAVPELEPVPVGTSEHREPTLREVAASRTREQWGGNP